MRAMTEDANLARQYENGENLSIRIRLHERYSVNRQGLVPWLFEQYRFFPGCRILELGCGTGKQWEGRAEKLPGGASLTLSDLSEGMVAETRRKFACCKHVTVEKIDIRNIPYPDGFFDAVIANYMLYHVAELPRALSEVRRVLAQNGVFYAATNGDGGMRPWLHDALLHFNPGIDAFSERLTFSLQNGGEFLRRYFASVAVREYEDSLEITSTQDLIDWISSTITIARFTSEDLSGLYDFFEAARQKTGSIRIPKETGLFIAEKVPAGAAG